MKKPIYKRVWFWVVVVLVLGGAGLLRDGGGEPEESPAPTAAVRSMPAAEKTPAPTPKPTAEPTPTATPKPAPAATSSPEPTPETIHGVPADTVVFVSEKSNTIHAVRDCSGMKNYREMSIAEADARGYQYCPHCW